MKYLFILSFILTYLFLGLELGYTATSSWSTHITYSFQHAGLMHLLLNCISFFFLFRVLEKYIASWHIAVIALSIAFAVSFLCIYSRVVVGASAMIYAMIGIYFFLVFIGKIDIKNKIQLFTGIAFIILSIIISFFKPNSAGLLHLLCLISGCIISSIYYLLNKPYKLRS